MERRKMFAACQRQSTNNFQTGVNRGNGEINRKILFSVFSVCSGSKQSTSKAETAFCSKHSLKLRLDRSEIAGSSRYDYHRIREVFVPQVLLSAVFHASGG
jgi:hypothetical protein